MIKLMATVLMCEALPVKNVIEVYIFMSQMEYQGNTVSVFWRASGLAPHGKSSATLAEVRQTLGFSYLTGRKGNFSATAFAS